MLFLGPNGTPCLMPQGGGQSPQKVCGLRAKPGPGPLAGAEPREAARPKHRTAASECRISSGAKTFYA